MNDRILTRCIQLQLNFIRLLCSLYIGYFIYISLYIGYFIYISLYIGYFIYISLYIGYFIEWRLETPVNEGKSVLIRTSHRQAYLLPRSVVLKELKVYYCVCVCVCIVYIVQHIYIYIT